MPLITGRVFESLQTGDYQSWSSNQWEKWVEEKIQERRKVFCGDPDELIAGYNREASSAHGYAGREILELIQNSDDAGAGFSQPNRMMIRLTHGALFVANTGIPFSPEGIKSLMVSDRSPKQLQRTQCIGYKGLGFRSVLGWSSNIVISSGNVTIGFSRNRAISWLKQLVKEAPNVDAQVRKVEAHGLVDPIATLSVPSYLTQERQAPEMGTESALILLELRAAGYDTVICLMFDDPISAYNQVLGQLNLVAPETLLFLQHLEVLEVITDEQSRRWEVERKNDQVIFKPTSGEPETWRISTDSGMIPPEFQRKDQPSLTKYEIKLATSASNNELHHLFVYFPTEVLFPFRSIAHATFELTENRQHLIESNVNAWLSQKLAQLMVVDAEKTVDPNLPWLALTGIAPRGDIDPVLVKLGFEESLQHEIRGHKVLPVRDSKFEAPQTVKQIRGDFDKILTGPVFGDLCLYTDDEFVKTLLQSLGVEHIQYQDLRGRVCQLSRTALAIEMRAELIHRFIDHGHVTGTPPPELLVDENGELIPEGFKALLPPEGKVFSLPSWVPQKFVNSELVAKLKDQFSLGRVRELAKVLSTLGVQEYSMATLLSSIVAEANRLARDPSTDELRVRQEMVRAIWGLYSTAEPGNAALVPEDVNVILPTRNGGFSLVRGLYLGKGYPGGDLLDSLYRDLGGPFVEEPSGLGIFGDPQEVKRFLCWLGAAELPLEKKTRINSGPFLNYVMNHIQYPVQFVDFIVQKKDVKSYNFRLDNVTEIDRIEEVLKTADPYAIIA